MKIKAAVCHEFGKPLVVEDVQIRDPKTGEIRVRVDATAICHSDIHFVRGDWDRDGPIVVGHETAGVVEEVGPGVTTVKVGDSVVVSLLRSCGRCRQCLSGSPFLCTGDFELMHDGPLRNLEGKPIRTAMVGSFAEQVIVDQSQVVGLEGLAPDVGCLLACGVITGVGAALNTAEVRPGQSVAVVGVGGVGLNVVQGAAIAGAYPIVAVDLAADKLEASLGFGATHTVNASAKGAIEEIRDITDGGVDFCFAAVGSEKGINQGFEMLGRGGTLVVVGLPPAGAKISVPARSLVIPRLGGPGQIIGSNMGSTRLQSDIPKLIAFYRNGRLKLDELITGRYPFDKINDAIDSAERGEALRNVVVF